YHRNMAMTFIDEPDPVRHLRHVLGAQNLLWSSDYPHPVSTWPKSLAVIEETFEGIPDDERDLMIEGNAARIWNLGCCAASAPVDDAVAGSTALREHGVALVEV